jgi:hypothetical protein
LRPVFVLCSVTLPRLTLPFASHSAITTPSIFRLEVRSISWSVL